MQATVDGAINLKQNPPSSLEYPAYDYLRLAWRSNAGGYLWGG